MIIYNVTINIDENVAEFWLRWIRKKYIPRMLNTGCFIKGDIYKILAESQGGESYSVQYLCKSMDDYTRYKKIYALTLQKEHEEKFNGKFVAFRTLLKSVS